MASNGTIQMNRLVSVLFLSAVCTTMSACSSPRQEIVIPDNPDRIENMYTEWCSATLQTIDRDFRISGTDSYYENQNRDCISFIWGNIFLLYTYNYLYMADAVKFQGDLKKCIVNIDKYWTTGYKGKDGYATCPAPNGSVPDRYYDENGWMSIGLSQAYGLTGDRSYLERAVKAYNFSMSGEDDILGGGIWFQESFSEFQPQKNTVCSCVAMISAMQLYNLTGDGKYLEDAVRLDKWTRANLLDRSDNLFWDAKMAGDGSVNRTKWSYNSGFMIRAWLLMYKATQDGSYLKQAMDTMAAAERRWYTAKNGILKDPGYFAFTIIDAWYAFYDLTGDESYLEKAFTATAWVHDRLTDENGRYPESWAMPVYNPVTQYDLRYSTVVSYIFAEAAVYKAKSDSNK